MNFVVKLSPAAEADLEHLFDFLLDQADTTEDLNLAQAAIDAIRATAQHRLAGRKVRSSHCVPYDVDDRLIVGGDHRRHAPRRVEAEVG